MFDSLATYSMQPPVVPVPRLPPTASARSCARNTTTSRSSNFTKTSAIVNTDPLLTGLSPEVTLKALTETADFDDDYQIHPQDSLSRSIAQLSSRERALGIHAAVAAQKLRQWYEEVLSWKWPSPREAALGRGFENPYAWSEEEADHDKAAIYLGCMLETVVDEHERRVGEIKDDLEDLGVEELKQHVLRVHLASIQSQSDNDSSGSPTYNRLNDFTTVITATILNGLPILAKLNNLLNTWDIRFEVLRQLPPLLESLKNATFEMDRALARLEEGLLPEFDDPRFTRRHFEIARARLEDILLVVGHHFDVVLDVLEGSEDCLPSYWIDDMDSLESDFASWSVAAQKKAVENEWHRDHPLDRCPSPIPEEADEGPKNESETIPRACAEPPEQRTYWTSSEDEFPDSNSSLETTPLSMRNSMPSITVRTAQGEDGLVVKGRAKSATVNGMDSAQECEHHMRPEDTKQASFPLLNFKDPFTDQRFSADDIEVLPEVEEAMSPTHPPQKRRMTLPLSRYIEEPDHHDTPLSLPDGPPSPNHKLSGGKRLDAIHRRNNDSKSFGPKNGNISLRDAFSAADALNQVIKSPRSSQSVRNLNDGRPELQDPFMEQPSHRDRSSSPSPPDRSLGVSKIRSRIPTPSSSPKTLDTNDKSDASPKSSPSPSTSPSKIPVRKQVDQSPSSPQIRRRRRRPTLEDKISTILDGIPVKLDLDPHAQVNGHLAPSKEKPRSASPSNGTAQYGAMNTYFRLIPAHQKRSKDESSVRLFHLYRGERLAPLKLYVRTIGENGERVMVRVGGGWADFGEYLREYVAHHGQRAVSEKWEVQGVSGNANGNSPSRQSPHKRHVSNPSKSGRTTPVSRPASRAEPFPDIHPALPPLPPMPKEVTQKERPSLTAANVAKASGSPAPIVPIFPSLDRRLSMSSVASGSLSVFSAFAESMHNHNSVFGARPVSRPGTSLGFRTGSSPFSAAPIAPLAPLAPLAPHSPLGLAGPRPRRMSITPESEAWVEDMMGKARNTSATKSHILSSIPFPHEEPEKQHSGLHTMRSFNDIEGFNKRVFLRQLKR